MKKRLLPVFAAAALLALPAFVPAAAPRPVTTVSHANGTETYTAQLNLTSLGWLAKKFKDSKAGSVPVTGGTLQVKDTQIVSGSFVFDMANLEAENDDYDALDPALTTALKSSDFFDTAKHPTATFTITGLQYMEVDGRGNNARITGSLTLKGISKPLVFPAKVGVKDGMASASGTATVDRTLYGISYGTKSLLGTAADQVIDDSFIISFNVIAKKAPRS